MARSHAAYSPHPFHPSLSKPAVCVCTRGIKIMSLVYDCVSEDSEDILSAARSPSCRVCISSEGGRGGYTMYLYI